MYFSLSSYKSAGSSGQILSTSLKRPKTLLHYWLSSQPSLQQGKKKLRRTTKRFWEQEYISSQDRVTYSIQFRRCCVIQQNSTIDIYVICHTNHMRCGSKIIFVVEIINVTPWHILTTLNWVSFRIWFDSVVNEDGQPESMFVPLLSISWTHINQSEIVFIGQIQAAPKNVPQKVIQIYCSWKYTTGYCTMPMKNTEHRDGNSDSKKQINIARGTTDPEIDSVTWIKFGNNMAILH